MDVRPLALKAPDSMLLNEEPSLNVTPVKLVQLKNAVFPILMTLDGMVMDVRPLPENALSPMLVILDGRVIWLKLVHPSNTLPLMEVILQGSSNVSSNVTVVNLLSL